MAAFAYIWMVTVLFNACCIVADYKDCSTFKACANMNSINCTENENCTINCGFHGCEYSTINCPINGNCIIQCTNQFSCKGITINATPNTILNVSCTGNREACKASIINGQLNTLMNIYCADSYACYGSIIDARNASKLQMIDCATDFWTCYMLTIYCPPNINGEKRCILQGDNSFGGEINEGITFYAINSWNDIEFQTSTKTDDYYGKMYCTIDYSQSCNISQCCGWHCKNINSICQNTPTLPPTLSPTNPTNDPTQIPTLYTTNYPISSIDTLLPTKDDQSAENMQTTTTFKLYSTVINIDKEDAHNVKTFVLDNSKYIPYIGIGLALLCMILCFECFYCYRKKRNKKRKQQISKSIYRNSTGKMQIVEMEGNTSCSNNWNGGRHYKQTQSNSALNLSGIWQQIDNSDDMMVMGEFEIRNAENDMEILGDDEYDENAIITKQHTFENAENDEEITSEGPKSKTNTESIITDENQDEVIGDTDQETMTDSMNEELSNDDIVTIEA